MEIKIVEDNTYNLPLKFVDDVSRYDTMTACEFVNDNTLVCANRQSAKLYLIHITKTRWSVLDTIDIKCNGKSFFPELIKKERDRYYATCFTGGYLTFQIVDHKITNLFYNLVDNRCRYHGLYPLSDSSVFLTNSRDNPGGIVSLHVNNSVFHYIIPGMETKRIKDICQLENQKWIILGSDSSPTLLPAEPYSAFVGLYSFIPNSGFLLKDMIVLKNTHLDSVVQSSNTCCITAQQNMRGSIIKVVVSSDKLSILNKITVKDFPHGIAVSSKLWAYTSYKDSTVNIFSMLKNV
jgi:hypothetical protein